MGIFTTSKGLGAFDNIDTVDLTGLSGCNIEVVAGEPPATVTASGPRSDVGSVEVEHTIANGVRTLVVRTRSDSNVSNTGSATAGIGGYANTGYDGPIRPGVTIRVKNTGSATATGPGGYANTGISRRSAPEATRKMTIIRDRNPLVIDRRAGLTVKIVVSPGTEVFYL